MNTFEEIGQYLPEERRERWFQLVTRLRKMHEDDDLLALTEIVAASGLVQRGSVSVIDGAVKKLEALLEKDRLENAKELESVLVCFRKSLQEEATDQKKRHQSMIRAIYTAAAVTFLMVLVGGYFAFITK